MSQMMRLWLIVCCAALCCLLRETYAVKYSITPSQSLSDGESLVSEKGSFELGFFSPGSSKNRYLGIWYRNIAVKTVVWVANRNNPIKDSSGLLMVNSTGSLVLSSRSSRDIWSTNSSREAKSPLVKLLDSGNLVLIDEKGENSDDFLWQSFDYPSDTLLPGMKLGWDLRIGLNRRLTAWKNTDDPAPGALSSGIELDKYPQVVMWKDSKSYFRSGPWNGQRFSGAPELRSNPLFDFNFISNQDEVYYMYQLKNKSVITRLVLNDTTSTRQRYVWVEADQSWRLYASVPRDYCDTYDLCGANGVCVMSESPVCQCLEGFKPKSPESWSSMDWSQGCVLSTPLNCSNKNVFVKFPGLKLPDTTSSWVNDTMSLVECRETCLKNCSCMAYANSDVRGRGSGCALWFGALIDIKQIPDGGQDLYIRIEASGKGFSASKAIIIVVITVAVFFGGFLTCYFLYRRKKGKGKESRNNFQGVGPTEDLDLPFFDLATISQATDGFSLTKKLGEGGFGPVYKGTLVDGQEFAVKRLSECSGQGLNEFKNEVRLIAKLQHRNLVKLIGFCIDGEEKMLIYEYMANKSLSSFLFDTTRKSHLNWTKRFQIICGIARGLLYLHQDSRLRIIHRDLKASNVLLDDDLNPKISDFGMARTFGGDQNEDKTRRVVGTYGYMAPEYALYGLFSVKSDVFSFGVLLLEIISGKKNGSFHHPQHHQNLIGQAWQVWIEGKPLELVDPSLDEDSRSLLEVLRCIQVGLLCIQQSPDDRPDMSSVILMLNGESTLPVPKQPGFLIDVMPTDVYPSSNHHETCSVNEITVTLLEAR